MAIQEDLDVAEVLLNDLARGWNTKRRIITMTRRMAYSFLFALIILFGSAPFDPASATLIFDSQISITGTGLGAVDTVLTIQKQGNATSDQGCVGRNNTTGCPGGTANSTPSDPGRVI